MLAGVGGAGCCGGGGAGYRLCPGYTVGLLRGGGTLRGVGVVRTLRMEGFVRAIETTESKPIRSSTAAVVGRVGGTTPGRGHRKTLISCQYFGAAMEGQFFYNSPPGTIFFKGFDVDC